MASSIFSVRPLPAPAPAPADNGTTRSFRFLDLPKEIRLMVYEELSVVTRRHDVLLRDRKHHITLVNTTVAGVSILATCRQVNQEASYILAPRLRKILQAPPKVVIQAEHLMGLIDLHDGFRDAIPENVLDRVMQVLSSSRRLRTIHNYREGKVSLRTVREKLKLNTLVDEEDEATLNAFMAFVLRSAAYIDSKPEVLGKYPPLAVIIVVPNHFLMLPVTTTTTLARAICYKLYAPRRRFVPRTQSGTATLSWLLSRFAIHSSCTCWMYQEVSLSVQMKREEGAAHQVTEQAFETALMRGVHHARQTGKGFMYYGGLAEDRAVEE